MADEAKTTERPDVTAGGVPDRLSFPATEETVLKLWQHLDAFKTQLRLSEVRPAGLGVVPCICVHVCGWAHPVLLRRLPLSACLPWAVRNMKCNRRRASLSSTSTMAHLLPPGCPTTATSWLAPSRTW